MEESDILDQLRDVNYIEHRAYLLDELIMTIQKHGGQVGDETESRQELFLSLAHVLTDSDWEVRLKAVEIIYAVIPHLDYELDTCMDYVLPQFIYNIGGENRPQLRKIIIHTLHTYMCKTSNISHVFHALVKYGIEHPDPDINMQAVLTLPILLTPDIVPANVYPLIESLVLKMCRENDDKLLGITSVTLDEIKSRIGEDRFQSYKEKLPPEIKARYQVREEQIATKETNELDVNSNQQNRFHGQEEYSDSVSHQGTINSESEHILHRQMQSNGIGFGIIPQSIMNGLMDQANWYERLLAAEKLKSLISELEDTSQLKNNFIALISFLCQLLEDLNFKVSIVTIQIIEQLVLKLNQDIKFYLKPVVSALTKRFGDNKTVIRQANMKVMKTLMQILQPKPVIDVVSESLRHRKSGVREEALYIIIASLLTFPSNDFDLPKLCSCVAPTLGDQKRKVRQAALETFAVLAQAMGPTKITPLIRAVDDVELHMNDEGVMKAVQARLARRQLPRINGEGMVELPSPLPSSASSRSASSVAYDTVWILKATGSTGSAKDRSYTDPAIELSQPSPNKSVVTNGSLQELIPPKRFYSAGRGRSKLPWEEDRDDRPSDIASVGYDGSSAAARGNVSSAPAQEKLIDVKPPSQPRQTWNGSEPNLWENSTKERRQRAGFLTDRQDMREPAVMGGSYRQNHVDKMKMMSLARMKTNDLDDAPVDGSRSAPVSDRAGSDTFPMTTSILSKKRDENKFMEIWNEKRIVYDNKQRVARRPKDLSAITKSPRRSFSNSWPDGSFGEDLQPQRNAVSNTPKRSAGHFSSPTAPIPLKATLARSSSRTRNKDSSPREEVIDIDFEDNTPLRSPDSDDDDLGATDFLQSVRSSAQKKRAQKQAKSNKTPSSYRQNSPPDLRDSAFFDNFTPMNIAVEEIDMNRPEHSSKNTSTKRVPPDSPFSSKPRIVRSSSGRNPRKGSAELANRKHDLVESDFNSAGGVTFRDNTTADVTVVGRGYNQQGQEGMRDQVADDALAAAMGGRQQNARERRRQQKGSVSSSGVASMQYQTGSTGEIDKWMSSDSSAIRGHGVFGNQQNAETDYQHLLQNRRQGNTGDRTEAGNEDPPEIVGTSYQQNSSDEPAKSDDEGLGMSMSRAVKDKITQKQEQQRKARQMEKSPREVNDGFDTEMRKKSLDDERQRLKERNEGSRLQRTPEMARADLLIETDIGFQSDPETEDDRQRQVKAQRYEAEVQREKEFRLDEEKRRASAERTKRLQAEEKRKQEEDEYRKLEMKERRIQADERRRMEDQRKLTQERRQVDEDTFGKRRMTEEEEMRLIQEEEDKYTAEEFEEDQASHYSKPSIPIGPRDKQRPPHATKRKKTKSPKSPGNRGLSESISGSAVGGQPETETPPTTENTYEKTDEMKPLPNPTIALKDALRFMEQEDWEIKNEGLNVVRRLALHHPQEFGSQIHTVVVAVLGEVKNLRSNVCKSAILCLADMFEALDVALDKELDQICRVLMPKALESNSFIRNSLDTALMAMVHNVSPQRALSALVSVGASHSSKMVRKTTARFLEQIVARMGPGRILSGIKDVTDKVLMTTAKLAMDPHQDTRFYARKIVCLLMQHEDFNRLIERHIPQRDLKSFQEVVANLRTKGLSEPSEVTSLSAKGSRRSLSNSRADSGSTAHHRGSSNGSANGERVPTSVKKTKRSSVRSEGQQEIVADLVKALTSSDWRQKIKAVDQFQELCETSPNLVTANIMKLFDGFCPRLADSNSKVCCVALDAMKHVIPHIAHGLPDVIPDVVAKLVKSLASKNNTIYQSSNQMFDILMDHVDNLLLVQHFAGATKCANARVKPPMIEKLTRLVVTIYPKKPQLINRQILPVLWDILGNMTTSGAIPGGSGNLRKATQDLVMSLYDFMGKDLLQEASSLPQRSRTALDGLLNS